MPIIDRRFTYIQINLNYYEIYCDLFFFKFCKVQECEKPPSVDLTNFKAQATLKKGANFMTAVPFKGKFHFLKYNLCNWMQYYDVSIQFVY